MISSHKHAFHSVCFLGAKVQKINCGYRSWSVNICKLALFAIAGLYILLYNKVYVEVHVRYMFKQHIPYSKLFRTEVFTRV